MACGKMDLRRWILATCTTSPLWTAFCPIGRNGANVMCRVEPYFGADSTCFFFLLCFNVQFVQTSTHSLFGEVWCWATGQKTSSGPVPLKRTNGSRNGLEKSPDSLWFSSPITCFACGNHCHGGIQAKVAMAVLLPCGSLVWQAM